MHGLFAALPIDPIFVQANEIGNYGRSRPIRCSYDELAVRLQLQGQALALAVDTSVFQVLHFKMPRASSLATRSAVFGSLFRSRSRKSGLHSINERMKVSGPFAYWRTRSS